MRASSQPFVALLPAPQWSEVHSRLVDAPRPAALRAAREVKVSEMPLARGLMLVRGMFMKRGGADRSLGDALASSPGFLWLGETEDAFAAGFVGTPWKPTGGRPPRLTTPEEFAAFDEPGYVKALTTFQVVRAPERCSRLVTETHIAATDDTAARNFGRYWALIRPGSGLVRRSWLAAAARRAESGP